MRTGSHENENTREGLKHDEKSSLFIDLTDNSAVKGITFHGNILSLRQELKGCWSVHYYDCGISDSLICSERVLQCPHREVP